MSAFEKSRTFRLTLRLNTPAFVGREPRAQTAEMRVPSIRGQLRFWARAIGPAHLKKSEKDLLELEQRLFGIAGRDSQKASKVCLALAPAPNPKLRPGTNAPNVPQEMIIREQTSRGQVSVHPFLYLGYGPYQYHKDHKGSPPVTSRGGFEANQEFGLRIRLRDGLDKDEPQLLAAALWGWTRFGGIGSRARRGFGSVQFNNPPDEDVSRLMPDRGEVPSADVWKRLRGNAENPGYSRISPAARLFKHKRSFRSWVEALASFGKVWKSVRNNLNDRHRGTKRRFLGMPLLVGGSKVPPEDARRASPFFFRVTYLPDKQEYLPLILFLPAPFLTEASETKLDKKGLKDLNDEAPKVWGTVCEDLKKQGFEEIQ
jgi:CRISPR-associated protein Cmr1